VLETAMAKSYEPETYTRAEVDALAGLVVIEFGTNWCGYCQAAQPLIESAFSTFTSIRHLKVEDGKGRPLGRSFRVKLWPTLIFLRDGAEVARVVRPTDADSIASALAQLSS
jgi:thioredoxin 1